MSGARPARETIRVMVADDVEPVRELLVELLDAETRIEICGTASDGLAAVALARQTRPDVILMDLKMPRMDGLTAAREILRERPAAKIILNSAYGDRSIVNAAREAGVTMYVTKDRRPAQLVEAILEIGPEVPAEPTTV